MAHDIVHVLCGKCKTRLQGPTNPKSEDVLSCLSCGNSDKLKNIHRIVGEFFKEETARHFQAMLRKAASGGKVLKYKGSPIQKRSYRFILNVKF